ncbi:restriction system protein [Catalinimonas alkaloidigena]|uniref:restriction endonuclease n=1 Tax=Catalinimonas alkaloidigena TaxID=1075417 RepID=UPI002404A987|nr:restriction endonuclease [Catalinimonas alkaloidigena]MDF9799503.1 restriction system protein [Catalinimonas alkaloidigena]
MPLQQGNEFIRARQYTSQSEEGTVFTVELVHTGLHAHKVFSSVDHPKIVHEIRDQIDAWDEQWRKRQNSTSVQEEPLQLSELDSLWQGETEKEVNLKSESLEEEAWKAREDQEKDIEEEAEIQLEAEVQEETDTQEPEALTVVSQQRVDAIQNILPQLLAQEISVEWERMKPFEDFTELPPARPSGTLPTEYPKEPDFRDYEFRPKLNLIDKTITPLKSKKRDKAYRNFQIAYKKWREICEMIDKENIERKERYAQEEQEWEKAVEAWKIRKDAFFNKQEQEHAQIDQLREAYYNKESTAILKYCRMIMEKIAFPAGFPIDFKFEYSRHDHCLMLELAMPSIEAVLMQKEEEQLALEVSDAKVHLNDGQVITLYNTALCGISLGILHALFQSDQADAFQLIRFNGWLASIEEESGNEIKESVISLHTPKAEFMEVKLSDEDPETLFKQLGGVTHTQLQALKPEEMAEAEPEKENEREAPQKEIIEQHESDNLVAMPWEDFAALITEVFEHEFNVAGGEVTLIKSDSKRILKAVAFDPDPIRGGKIVIYAQRKRKKVSLPVLQTLFEHVTEMKATKGILITTAEYEEDARAYVRDKPISLLNGKHLLSLLDKHGHAYRIDFQEAKSVE